MVHLSSVPKDADVDGAQRSLNDLDLSDAAHNEFTTSVYGSRFAAEDLPKHEMPEKEMPKEVAYRMIKWVMIIDASCVIDFE